MHLPSMGRTFCQFAKHMDALHRTLTQLIEQVLPALPASPPQESDGEKAAGRAMTEIERTESDWDDPGGAKHTPACEDGARLAGVFADDAVDDSWCPNTSRFRNVSQDQSEPESHPLSEPQPTTGVASTRFLLAPSTTALVPQTQNAQAAVKPKLTITTMQGKTPGRSLSTPGTRRPRSLSWYEILDYRSEPVLGPITWQESVEDEVCIEGIGPFWSGANASIEGYIDGRRASLLTSFDRKERSVAWEAELKLFRQAHELERAMKEVAGLKERIRDLQAVGKMYRDDLIMATQDIEYLEEQRKRDNTEYLAARGCMEELEMRWEKDHAELLIAREYIKEFEETEVQCKCSRKRKWEPEGPGPKERAKANKAVMRGGESQMMIFGRLGKVGDQFCSF